MHNYHLTIFGAAQIDLEHFSAMLDCLAERRESVFRIAGNDTAAVGNERDVPFGPVQASRRSRRREYWG